MLFVIVFTLFATPSFSARILGIASSPCYSHQIVFRPLWRELLSRGHQLTVLTTHPMNESLTNLTEIDLNFSCEIWKRINKFDLSITNVLRAFNTGSNTASNIIDQQLQHPEVQALINNETEHFDLLIAEALFPAMYAFSERFNCPFIAMSSLDAPSRNYDIIGNPLHPVLNPNFLLPFAGKLSFIERLTSTFFSLLMQYYNTVHYMPSQQLLVQKHFGNNYPSLITIARNVSLLFVNTNPILYRIRPLLPAVIEIGIGFHILPPKPLPQDLQKLLDNAKQGFIYISLGTSVKNEDLPSKTRDVFLETFAQLPYLVLWKYDQDFLDLTPKNVFISKWFPQQDIFRHPNIKLVIFQGGLQSLEEAIYNHIPIIGMPLIGDQHGNVNNIVSKGLGLSLDYNNVNKTILKAKILEVIKNDGYRNRVKTIAELARDQAMTGLERAVWWTEYVLRHKGAKHLRSPAMDLPFYKYYLLDLICFCLLIFLVVICILRLVLKLIFKGLSNCSRPKVKVQ